MKITESGIVSNIMFSINDESDGTYSNNLAGYEINDGHAYSKFENGKGSDKLSISLLVSTIASIASILFGFTMGYTSPTQKQIEQEYLTQDQFSWFAVSFRYYYHLYCVAHPGIRDNGRTLNTKTGW